MKGQVTLLFGVHNHQPVGNFGVVFEQLYERSYGPFVRILREYPSVKCTFHVTGPLWEWMIEHAPEYVDAVREMAARGQVEIFTGGLYEPILPILPERDQVGQIRGMTDLLKKELGVRARGMWVAERVWEPHLPMALKKAGVEYITIDDAHLKSAGFGEQDTFTHSLTEEQGATVGIFPISEKMRYLVPFRPVEESIEYLRGVADASGDRCVVLMDDGEKFGGWPDTYEWIIQKGWLERFFQALERNADWLATATFAEWFDRHRPRGIVYLPSASYTEMGEWSLLPDAAREYGRIRHELKDRHELERYDRFLKGGIWRNFLSKYAESNHLHKRMTAISAKVEAAEKAASTDQHREKVRDARRALYRGQCNCPYWHGIFGGLYLNHLRFAVYRELIEAEKLSDEVLEPMRNGFEATESDFNMDGLPELTLGSRDWRVILEPGRGGSIIELDSLPRPINLSDVLTRRPEAYHEKLRTLRDAGEQGGVASIHDSVRTKEPGLERMLWYDPYRRASLLDRFLDPGTNAGDLRTVTARERGDFLGQPFTLAWEGPKKKGGAFRVELAREGSVRDGEVPVPLRLVKRLEFRPGALAMKAALSFTNRGDRGLRFLYLNEWNLTLLTGSAPDRLYYVKGRDLREPLLASMGEEEDVTEAGMTDGWLDLRVAFSSARPMRFLRYPIETISQSEGGFERVYQGSCLSFGWDLSLEPGETQERELELGLSERKG